MPGAEGLARAQRWWDQGTGAAVDARRDYDRRNSQEIVRVAAETVQRLAPSDRYTTVVDIGCGDGTLLHRLADARCADRYIGIDPRPEGVTSGEIEFLRASAEETPEVLSGIEGAVLVVATLTIGLWHQPERLLGQLLADHEQVRDLVVADIVRPATDRAWSIWWSFARDDMERSYLEDHASVLLAASRWASLVSDVCAASPDIGVRLETFDLRTPGIGGREWSARDRETFSEQISAAPAPQCAFLHAFR